MVRKSLLTENEKGQIRAFHQVGLSNREIARRLGRCHEIVGKYLADPDGYGTLKSPGRPQVLIFLIYHVKTL